MVTTSSAICCAREDCVEQLHNRMKKNDKNLHQRGGIGSSYSELVSVHG
jgi:hypothetical protein